MLYIFVGLGIQCFLEKCKSFKTMRVVKGRHESGDCLGFTVAVAIRNVRFPLSMLHFVSEDSARISTASAHVLSY
jgi:hypothetical protein